MVAHRRPVIDIFNYYIKNGFEAYREIPLGYEYFDSILEKSKEWPAIVAKAPSNDVIGFAYLHPYSNIETFKRTAKVTYFIHPEHTRKGVGKGFLEELVLRARRFGVDNLLAHISSLNEASLNFHLKNGFQECGRFKKIGRKLGRDFDIIWVQRRLS